MKKVQATNQLRPIRRFRGESLRSLAASVGISHTQIARLELGKTAVSAECAKKIADALRIGCGVVFKPSDGEGR